jgi:hypothetical protein
VLPIALVGTHLSFADYKLGYTWARGAQGFLEHAYYLLWCHMGLDIRKMFLSGKAGASPANVAITPEDHVGTFAAS